MNRLALLVVVILLGLTGAAAPVRADPPSAKPPKASSFAPHHTGRRVYGSPIEPTILHSRKHKPATRRAAPTASEPASHTAARQP